MGEDAENARSTPGVPAAAARSLHEEAAALAGAVDAWMSVFLDRRNLPPNLDAAVRYALLGGGKRLRPVLVCLCCEAVGGGRADALAAAGAVEMIHAFSLVHDDLPALDDDDVRRGRPTLHVAHGEAMALLAGDALMALPFVAIGEAYGPEVAGRLTFELAQGTASMIAGQVLDTLGGFDADAGPRERVDAVHRNKTGALIRAACRMGALCGDADERMLAGVTAYAEAIGVMFQIVDDLLDVEGEAEEVGKRVGKDQEAGKLTYPGVLGVAGSRREVERLRGVAVDAAAGFGDGGRLLGELADSLAVRRK